MLMTVLVTLIRKSRKLSFLLKPDIAKLVRIFFPGSDKLTCHLFEEKKKRYRKMICEICRLSPFSEAKLKMPFLPLGNTGERISSG